MSIPRLSITKFLLAYAFDGFRLIHATRRSTRELRDIQLPIRRKFPTAVLKYALKLANWMSHSPRATDFPLFHGSRSHPDSLLSRPLKDSLVTYLCDSWRDVTKLQRGYYRNTHDCTPRYTCHVCKNHRQQTSSFSLTKDVYAITRCLNMEHCAKLVGGNNDNKLR